MIYIFSAARSGSTWLGKIFDSHPDVLYLHEPELVDRGLDVLPFWFEHAPTSAQIESAKRYLAKLMATRSPRTTGTRPFFRKRYRSAGAEKLRRALIYAAKGSERAGFARYSDRFRVPDLCDRGRPAATVIKSVSALGRAEALIEAGKGNMRPVLLIRHPCGYIGSMLRGEDIEGFTSFHALGRLLDTRSAKRLGVDAGALQSADHVEMLAWNWLLSNAEAYGPVQGEGGETVVYEALTSDAKGHTRALFDRLRLNCMPETDAFLDQSAAKEGGYYSVYRDPQEAAGRWRKELGPDVVDKVQAIVTRDAIGRLFF
jgi:hypothetical protein